MRFTCCCILALEIIMTFGGSPTGVAAPPILENMTSAMSTCFGSIFLISHNLIVTGVISKIVVTLSKNADKTPVKTHSVNIKGHNCPFANRNAFNKNILNFNFLLNLIYFISLYTEIERFLYLKVNCLESTIKAIISCLSTEYLNT